MYSARQEEDMRKEAGSPQQKETVQQQRQDLGRSVEAGCREWVAWCSGKNATTNKTAMIRIRVLKKNRQPGKGPRTFE